MRKLVLLTIAGTGLIGAAHAKTPAEQVFGPIAKENKMQLLRPARADVAPGDSYRASDTQIIKRGCFTGDSLAGSVLRTSEKTIDYSHKVGLEADWLATLGLKVDYDRVGKVTLKLGNFDESGIINIHPTFAPHCLQEGYVRNDPIVASLVKVSSIEADVYDKNNIKLGFDATAEAVKTIANVTGQVQLERSQTSSTKIAGRDVFVMFRPFKPSINEQRFRLTCALNTPCTTRKYGYTLRVNSLEGQAVSASISNPTLRPAMSNRVAALKAGDAFVLQEIPLRRDYIQVESVDSAKQKAVITLSVAIFNVEAGPLAPAMVAK
jgi:hypothetical protein